ncbi:hypothetical protein OLMES_5204 [Oleiphilus messinensis]|uniref:Uncharacterized protein n=1 Tax=Oleiphilus messinensis TaxID=141451 RepID=A0A1Y0IF67_9GAMM|nr:hypothetical protein OLMES_5204 [Oleiphilus messinensis]
MFNQLLFKAVIGDVRKFVHIIAAEIRAQW